MKTREKFEGTEMADIMWNMVEATHYEGGVITGKVYWEDCLEFADKLHRLGYRRVAEPESNDIVQGVVLEG